LILIRLETGGERVEIIVNRVVALRVEFLRSSLNKRWLLVVLLVVVGLSIGLLVLLVIVLTRALIIIVGRLHELRILLLVFLGTVLILLLLVLLMSLPIITLRMRLLQFLDWQVAGFVVSIYLRRVLIAVRGCIRKIALVILSLLLLSLILWLVTLVLFLTRGLLGLLLVLVFLGLWFIRTPSFHKLLNPIVNLRLFAFFQYSSFLFSYLAHLCKLR